MAKLSQLSRAELLQVAERQYEALRSSHRNLQVLQTQNNMLRCALRTDVYAFASSAAPDFRPLGGNRQDCAVVACAAFWLCEKRSCGVAHWAWGAEEKEENEADEMVVVHPGDVLDRTLAIVCAPVIIASESDIPRQTLSFCSLFACRLRTLNQSCLRDLTEAMSSSDQHISITVETSPAEVVLSTGFFSRNGSLSELDMRRSHLQKIDVASLGDCYNIARIELPATLTEIRDRVLTRAKELKRLDMRNTAVCTIGSHFLQYSERLVSLHVSDRLTEIGDYFLNGCPALGSIDLRNASALRSVGDYFLNEATAVTSVQLPASLTEISDFFLYRCRALQELELQHTSLGQVGVTKIGDYFVNDCPALGSIDLRNASALRSVGKYFLNDATAVTSVQLPASLTEISDFFLYRCRALQELELQHTSLRHVGDDFACQCTSLTRVLFPASITEVGWNFCCGSDRENLRIEGSPVAEARLHGTDLRSLFDD